MSYFPALFSAQRSANKAACGDPNKLPIRAAVSPTLGSAVVATFEPPFWVTFCTANASAHQSSLLTTNFAAVPATITTAFRSALGPAISTTNSATNLSAFIEALASTKPATFFEANGTAEFSAIGATSNKSNFATNKSANRAANVVTLRTAVVFTYGNPIDVPSIFAAICTAL